MNVPAGKYRVLLKTGNGLGMSTEGNYCCVALDSEVWKVTPVQGTNTFYLTYDTYKNKEVSVEVTAYFDGDGNNIALAETLDLSNPEFALILNDVGDGWVAINNHDETRVFDANGDNPKLGASVQAWKWNKGDNQRWKFVPV